MTIHQPAKDEFEKFTHCLVMGYGGIPLYFGPTGDPAYGFVRFDSLPRRGVCPALQARGQPARHVRHAQRPRAAGARRDAPGPTRRRRAAGRAPKRPKGGAASFFGMTIRYFSRCSPHAARFRTAPAASGVPHRADVAVVRQLGLLLSRYWRVRLRDRLGRRSCFCSRRPSSAFFCAVLVGRKTPFRNRASACSKSSRPRTT